MSPNIKLSEDEIELLLPRKPTSQNLSKYWTNDFAVESSISKHSSIRLYLLIGLIWILSFILIGYEGVRLGRSMSLSNLLSTQSSLTSPTAAPSLCPSLSWSTGTTINPEFISTFNGSALSQLCDQTVWIDGRYFLCEDFQGGITNVKNAILHCVRYSIESGSAFILPEIHQRGAVASETSNLISGGKVGIDYLFDLEYFQQVLESYCPQMRIYSSINFIPHKNSTIRYPMNPKYIHSIATAMPNNPDGYSNDYTETFRRDFDIAMNGILPLVFRTSWPLYFQWPVRSDSTTFWHNFGQILQHRQDSKQLASQIIDSLSRISSNYLAVHLRTEADVLNLGSWTKPNIQMESYVNIAVASGQKVMYVAGGDESSIQVLAQLASTFGIQVVSKSNFLPYISSLYLNSLHFDQRASVDFLVSLAAEKFAGVAVSSFSASLAIHRHNRYNDDTEFPVSGDEFSQLLDTEDLKKFVTSIWP